MRPLSVLLVAASLLAAVVIAQRIVASEAEVPAVDNVITVKLSGPLKTVWDIDKQGVRHLFLATVEAGGTTVQLDPAGCPKISEELVNYNVEMGGAIVIATRADVEGEMMFLPFAQTDEGENRTGIARRLPPDTLVPVVRVRTLKITTLPDVPKSGRDRDVVKSTTVGMAKS